MVAPQILILLVGVRVPARQPLKIPNKPNKIKAETHFYLFAALAKVKRIALPASIPVLSLRLRYAQRIASPSFIPFVLTTAQAARPPAVFSWRESRLPLCRENDHSIAHPAANSKREFSLFSRGDSARHPGVFRGKKATPERGPRAVCDGLTVVLRVTLRWMFALRIARAGRGSRPSAFRSASGRWRP